MNPYFQRAPGVAPYGIATPGQPLEHKKVGAPQAVLPGGAAAVRALPGREPVRAPPLQQQSPAMPVVVAPAAVASTPGAAQPKMQPLLKHPPNFRPPEFETVDGQLPCPESPEVSPREEEDASVWESQVTGPPMATTPVAGGAIDPATVKRERDLDAERRDAEASVTPFPVGSHVEYRSRSSGQWILAKVESYDESGDFYKLDVQPHAIADRVRARMWSSSGGDPDGHRAHRREQRHTQREQRDSVRDKDRSETPSRLHSGLPAREGGTGGTEGDRDRTYDSGQDALVEPARDPEWSGVLCPVPSNVEPIGQVTVPMPLGNIGFNVLETDSTESLSPKVDYNCLGKGRSATGEVSLGDEATRNSYLAENDMLKLQVAKLTKEVETLTRDNEALHEKVRKERDMKDRYFQELCICHKQLRENNRSTPRAT